jgi:hypothetical protein
VTTQTGQLSVNALVRDWKSNIGDPISSWLNDECRMTNDEFQHVRHLSFVIRTFALCPNSEQKRQCYADGCAKVAHHLYGRNE